MKEDQINMKINVNQVINNALCTGCGGCVFICPTKALQMRENTAGYWTADLDDDLCINCKKCTVVCPSNAHSIGANIGDFKFHGPCKDAFIGYAVDDKVRELGQSGGLVSTLLCYLKDKNLIDGAVVNKFDSQNCRSKAVWADTKESILKGAGSYYSQSSVVETTLEYCQKNKRVATVMLGCQSESIHYIRENNLKVKLPEYVIGLICAGQNSGRMIDDLIKQSGSKEVPVAFRFRDKRKGNWPGNIKIYTNDKEYTLHKDRRIELKPVYEMYRCLMCYDQMNIHSDIVVGDPWGINRSDIKKGYSVAIARTEKGRKLLLDAQKDGWLFLESILYDKILLGQTVDGRLKTKYKIANVFAEQVHKGLPYGDSDKIELNEADLKEKRDIENRLKYTRNLYLEKSPTEINKLIANKKRYIRLKKTFEFPFVFVKKSISFILRRLVKK